MSKCYRLSSGRAVRRHVLALGSNCRSSAIRSSAHPHIIYEDREFSPNRCQEHEDEGNWAYRENKSLDITVSGLARANRGYHYISVAQNGLLVSPVGGM